MLKAGVSQCEILTRLARAGEVLAGPDASVSILVLDDDGLLRNGASPNLPSDYLNAIDRLKPDAKVGTCAAAAATGSVVMTPDFFADDKWSELRHLPSSLGYDSKAHRLLMSYFLSSPRDFGRQQARRDSNRLLALDLEGPALG